MNKYIETDLRNGEYYLYCGIMNVISELEHNNINEYDFGKYVSYSLLKEALEERNWKEGDDIDTNDLDFQTYWTSPQNKEYIVEGCFLYGGLKIRKCDEID